MLYCPKNNTYNATFITRFDTMSQQNLRRIVRRVLVGVPLVLPIYLCIVTLWAVASISTILAQHPVASLPARLSPQQSALLLKIEDPTFFSHHGLSIANGQGATTITSALARDVFLFRSDLDGVRGALQSLYRGVFACCKRVDLGRDIMALALNANLGKHQQLALFVDQVYMGRHQGRQLHGLAHASTALFGKALAQLTEAEFGALVGMIRAPNQLHPVANRVAHQERQARVRAIGSGRCTPQGWFDTTYAACPVFLN